MLLLPHNTLKMYDLEILSGSGFKKIAQNDPKPDNFVEILLKSTQHWLVTTKKTLKEPFLITFKYSTFETQTGP